MNMTEQAQELLRAGKVAEAEVAYARVLELLPDDREALNVLGLAALRARDHDLAVKYLRRAATAHPADALTRYHHGRALDEAGAWQHATAEYESATRLQPDLAVAHLYHGALLDRRGESARAMSEYVLALDQSQRQGRWTEPATTPRSLQPLVERAVRQVFETKRAIAERVLAPLEANYGLPALLRVRRAIRVFLREESPVYPDKRQQPSFFYFPGLPTVPYLERSLFPWIEALESQTDAIRGELLHLLDSDTGRERVFLSEEMERANLRGIRRAPSWNGYYFYRHGRRRDDNCSACPVTAAAIDALPLPRVERHGPEVLFSVFTSGTHLLPHRGVTNTRLVSHLPLIVPADCALQVGGETHTWQEGRVVVFDDTYEHDAWNRSDELRVVLIVDLWNPHLTQVEREAVAELIAQMDVSRPVGAA